MMTRLSLYESFINTRQAVEARTQTYVCGLEAGCAWGFQANKDLGHVHPQTQELVCAPEKLLRCAQILEKDRTPHHLIASSAWSLRGRKIRSRVLMVHLRGAVYYIQ